MRVCRWRQIWGSSSNATKTRVPKMFGVSYREYAQPAEYHNLQGTTGGYRRQGGMRNSHRDNMKYWIGAVVPERFESMGSVCCEYPPKTWRRHESFNYSPLAGTYSYILYVNCVISTTSPFLTMCQNINHLSNWPFATSVPKLQVPSYFGHALWFVDLSHGSRHLHGDRMRYII